VVVVEDDLQVRTMVRSILAEKGYRVLVADGGEDALALLKGHPGKLGLLLTDVIMPTMNGRELAEKVRFLRPGIKVLFMSGYTDNIIARNHKADPSQVLLQKPFTPLALSSKVREVLDSMP
jgi:two-component system, cell cycle sensor histidine kinase and response regulator CckA